MCAAYSGTSNCVDILLSYGQPVLQNPKSLIYWSIKGENIPCCTKLFDLKVLETVNEELDLCELISKDILEDNAEMLSLILKYYPQLAFQHSRPVSVYLFPGSEFQTHCLKSNSASILFMYTFVLKPTYIHYLFWYRLTKTRCISPPVVVYAM